MNFASGPNGVPELQSFSAEERRQLWQEQYRKVLRSRFGVMGIAVYAACLAGAMVLGDHYGLAAWVGILAGNLAGSLFGQGIVVAEVRSRLTAMIAAKP